MLMMNGHRTYELFPHSVNQFYFEVKITQQGEDGYIGNFLPSNTNITTYPSFVKQTLL